MGRAGYNAARSMQPRRARNPRLDYEDNEQAALFDWARLHEHLMPELRMLAHVPNEGKRSNGSKLVREGLRSGYPDIILDVARGGFHGLRIELKTQRGRTSKEQIEWIAALKRQGYYATVAHGWIEAREVITMYLRWQ